MVRHGDFAIFLFQRDTNKGDTKRRHKKETTFEFWSLHTILSDDFTKKQKHGLTRCRSDATILIMVLQEE